MLVMRDRSESTLEDSTMRIEELRLAFEEATVQIQELSAERDSINEAAQKACSLTTQNEHNIRIKLEAAVAENLKLRETTVASERGKAERAFLELKKERAETERLDAENVHRRCQAVVEQKTQALMKSDERLENVRRVARREAAADKAEIERLTERLYQEHHAAINQLRSAVQAIESESIKDVENVVSTASSNSTAFVHETENANAELLQVCEENRQLEQNLHVSNCARERAELRCSEALGEIEAQKVDLVAMAAQLKEAEIVKSNAHYGQNLNFRVKMLQSSLSEKEARIRGLREALVKLKAEFVAAEEVLKGSP